MAMNCGVKNTSIQINKTGRAIYPTHDNGYIITGTSSGAAFQQSGIIMKTDSLGNMEWENYWDYGTTFAGLVDVIQTTDYGYAAAGYASVNGNLQIYLVKLLQDGVSLSDNPVESNSTIKIFPNPVDDIINIHIDGLTEASRYKLYDQFGRLLKTGTFEHAIFNIDINEMASGIYLLSIEYNNLVETRKLIKR